MLIYSEKFVASDFAEASLEVVKRASGTVTLVAYLPGGDCPNVFVNGTIEECRAKWKTAKTWVRNYLGIR